MSKKYKYKSSRKVTNGKCDRFVNGHCSYDCPNASLEGACDRWDLEPSDFGMEYIKCKDCSYWDDNCSCDDCFMQCNKDYCPKERNKNES